MFDVGNIGDPSVLDCWAMRHGIDTPGEYHRDPNHTHAQSVYLIATEGLEVFAPSPRLGYDGAGMQVAGFIGVQRTGLAWEALAAQRLFAQLEMASTG